VINKKNSDKKILYVAKYERVSSDKQAKDGDSLRDQDETLNEYISKRDDMILYDTYIDDGISGQKLQRDDFTRLMHDVESGHVDVIIFTKLDRWFRSLRHYLNTQAFLESHNVGWIAIRQEYYDTTTAYGRAFVAQSMTWAELEAQNGSERIRSVFANKVKNGEVISGNTPVGYKIVDKHLVPGDDVAIVHELFNYYAHYNNISALMQHMRNDFGFDRSPATLRKIIKNRIYIGEYHDNLTFCEPLVDRDLFDRVQYLLSCNIRENKKRDYMFSGMIRCAECDRAVSASNLLIKGRKRLDGTRKRYHHKAYRCKSHFDNKKCHNSKVVFESVLERWLIGNVQDCIKNYIADYQVSITPAIDISEKRRKIESKIKRLKELYVNELISIEEYKIDKAEFQNQLDAMPVNIVPIRNMSSIDNILDLDISESYGKMEYLEKQAFWRSFVKTIYYDNDKNYHIIFY